MPSLKRMLLIFVALALCVYAVAYALDFFVKPTIVQIKTEIPLNANQTAETVTTPSKDMATKGKTQ